MAGAWPVVRLANVSVAGSRSGRSAAERIGGRQALALVRGCGWATAIGIGVLTGAGILLPPLVVVALGAVVGRIPAAFERGVAASGLIEALIVAALVYAASLVLNPVTDALATTVRSRITLELQGRMLRAVSAPVGIGHLEDPATLDRLSRAEGSLTGVFPGDAPLTWLSGVAGRLSGLLGCVVLAGYRWWIGAGLALMWVGVRHLVLATVLRQATELRGEVTAMRRAWYLVGVGAKARDAKEVRVYGLADFLSRRFRDEYGAAMAAGQSGMRALHRRAGAGFLLVLVVLIGVVLELGIEASRHTIDLHTLAVQLPMIGVTMALGAVSYDDITTVWALSAVPDVDRLETELAGRTLAGRVEATGLPRTGLRFEQVRFHYPGSDREVLAGVDLDLPAGSSTAIVGINGAGKSTLVSLISRLRDPTAGRITVDGLDLSALDASAWQRQVAVLSQDPVRFPTTARANIAYGAIEHADDAAGIEECARHSGFLELAADLPAGLDTLLVRELPGGVDLSGGGWQRLALARALFATRHGARVLILDEPTAALDVRAEARLHQQFLQITRGLTTVVISHRFATVRQAQTICLLDGGVIVERGSHQELLAANGTYTQMYRMQAARFAGASR